MSNKPTLYGYWRSSASYRVRIVLALKGIDYHYRSVHLVKDGGEHHTAAYRELNPQALVPTYQDAHITLGQSQAIIDYIDAQQPNPPLLPNDPVKSAHCRAMAQIIACEIHPLDNLSVLSYLKNQIGVSEDEKLAWYRHWIDKGFRALEQQTRALFGDDQFSLGGQPGYFEAFLVPQMYNARRFHCPLDDFPNLCAIDSACQAHPAFAQAAPEAQPDAT